MCLVLQRPDVPELGDTQGEPTHSEKGRRMENRAVGGGDWEKGGVGCKVNK